MQSCALLLAWPAFWCSLSSAARRAACTAAPPLSLCQSSSRHGSAQRCRPSAKVHGVRWRHSRCMGLHILVGLVGLTAQPLGLGQRGRVRLLAALAAVLVVVQLLVRCRLLLPASRETTHHHWAMLCLGPRPCNRCARAAACLLLFVLLWRCLNPSAPWQLSPQ